MKLRRNSRRRQMKEIRKQGEMYDLIREREIDKFEHLCDIAVLRTQWQCEHLPGVAKNGRTIVVVCMKCGYIFGSN